MIAKLEGITLTEEDKKQTLLSIAKTTANTNASLQDLRKGLKTEVRYFNGEVVSLAKKHNVDAKLNLMVYNLMSYLENTKKYGCS